MYKNVRSGRLVATIALAALIGLVGVGQAQAAEPSAQPKTGPGGADYAHAGVREISGGSGANAWYAFLPTKPRPQSAPLTVITHGYYEFKGHATMDGLIRHTVRQGNVVIYPRWQTATVAPCPGPINIQPCLQSMAAGVKGGLRYLKRHPTEVQADTRRTNYFGFSFGGIVTANVLAKWKTFDVPKPATMFLDDPHDGGLTGAREPAVAESLAGIPSTTLAVCHSGSDGVLAGTYDGTPSPDSQLGQSMQDASCNALFPKLTSIPSARKALVMTSTDGHGQPGLSSAHGVCAGPGAPDPAAGETKPYPVDAYDWGFCWRVSDALRSCAAVKLNCRSALGDTPENRFIGTWSDGTPISGLQVVQSAPVRPLAEPPRAAKPSSKLQTDRAPSATISAANADRVSGTATDDHGLDAVRVAVVRRAGGRCRQLTRGGRAVALEDCGRPTQFVKARGTRRWALRLRGAGRPGAYRVFVVVTDSAGREAPEVSIKSFRVA